MNLITYLRRPVLAFTTVTLISACDNGLEPDDHQEAIGVEVRNASGAVIASAIGAVVTGTLTVPAGGEVGIDIFFVDQEGDRFQLEGDETTLDWTVENDAIAEIEAHEGHYDLVGHTAGSTTVSFAVVHGAHNDYESAPIPIVVTP